MFQKILIANRGEIACRVIRTAKKLGVKTVAVYSDADANAQHVLLADEAVYIGAAPARESYLQADKIIAACQQTGAQAVHPGYGFLSENEGFAEACRANNIVFIGPPVEAIRAMGLKATSKALMEKADVPLTPGYHGNNQDPEFLHQEADKIGYPVLIKASAGGGGKGMSLVENSADFQASLASCKREAKSSFGNDDVLIEKYIVRPRHVEVQVFGDTHGNYVHLFERDCSVQRRHQKVLEEAPAPNVPEHYLTQMREAAINAARAVGYVGAGTVEFIAQQSGEFYFMEMNTRLQVEHPVTEMITGQDLVEWQLRVASGEPLPKQQAELSVHGHAMEARIYAEDPDKGFLPSIGKITYMHQPQTSEVVRVDSGVVEGDTISAYYDPMIAKLIVWGEDRATALQRMYDALGEFNVLGLGNNVGFLRRLASNPAFANIELDTGLIEKQHDLLFPEPAPVADEIVLMAALALSLEGKQASQEHSGNSVEPQSPWYKTDGWRMNAAGRQVLNFKHAGQDYSVAVEFAGDESYKLVYQGQEHVAKAAVLLTGRLRMAIDGYQTQVRHVFANNQLALFVNGAAYTFEYVNPYVADAGSNEVGGQLRAPMPGSVVQVMVEAGQTVKKGQALLILEAMKMEHTITAPSDGVVKQVLFAVGDQVGDGDELLQLEADE